MLCYCRLMILGVMIMWLVFLLSEFRNWNLICSVLVFVGILIWKVWLLSVLCFYLSGLLSVVMCSLVRCDILLVGEWVFGS